MIDLFEMMPVQYVEFVIYGVLKTIKVKVSDYFELSSWPKNLNVQVQKFQSDTFQFVMSMSLFWKNGSKRKWLWTFDTLHFTNVVIQISSQKNITF